MFYFTGDTEILKPAEDHQLMGGYSLSIGCADGLCKASSESNSRVPHVVQSLYWLYLSDT